MVDRTPTLLEGLLGVRLDDAARADLDGVDQWRALTARAPAGAAEPRSELLINIDYLDANMDYLGFYRMALRMGDWKAIFNEEEVYWYEVPSDPYHVMSEPSPGSFQYSALFNITGDPHERFDRSADFPDVMALMFERLMTRYVPRMSRSGIITDDARAKQRWAASGYVGPWLSTGVRSCTADLSDRRAEFEAKIWGASDGDSESGGYPCAAEATALDDMAESADEDPLRR